MDGEFNRGELMGTLGLSDRKSFRERYLDPAFSLELTEMTIPDKPRSSKQKYRLTTKGRQLLEGQDD